MKKLKIIHLQQMYVGVNKKDPLHRFFYRNIDAWISPLPYLKENTLQNTPIPAQKIHIVPLCIETEKFVKPKDKTQIREQLNLPLGKKIVGIIGRIDDGKGQEFVIEALAQVRAKGYDIDALVMGDETKGKENTYLPYLKELAKKLHIEPFVHFRGHWQAVEQAYATLDFFVVASLEETYGMVTIEAMASRLPVIGVATFGTKDLITPEKTGLYCQPKDAVSIAQALTRLLENPDFAEKIAQNAQKEVQEKYKHSVMVQAITSILADLYKTKSPKETFGHFSRA
ncbi:MAG: glycosyltransferase family 4 protein [Raineya sp.]